MKLKPLVSTIAIAVSGILAMSSQTYKYPYQNPSLPSHERAADLCSRLTLDEKVSLMMNTSPAIPRLGIPAFDWWSEALHGVGRNGLATVFPSCIGMAAAFDDDLLTDVYTAVSDEARAKNALARRTGKVGKYKSLSFWTPTVNIFRDPRWGRGQESYGEDPYMNGRMGSRVVRALQGEGQSKYLKLHACAKHFAVHSGPEKTRHSFDIQDLPVRDLWETYLPAFRALVQDAHVQQVMCAYQRFDGEACCGSNRLLNGILRYKWGFDGLVVSDCGAIRDFYLPGRHGVATDAPASSALAVRSGTDVECGGSYNSLPDAVRRGDIDEREMDTSVRRLLKGRFDLGDLDPDSIVSWTSIPMSVVASPEHIALARRAACEQMVLLKNNGILPLSKTKSKFMLMGPNAADSTMMWGIYFGQPSHTVTVREGIERKVGNVPYTRACGITDLTDKVSLLDKFVAPTGAPGLRVDYWNNPSMEGLPEVRTIYNAPIILDNGGNTAFAPGVNLSNFSLRACGSFTADRDEELDIIYNNDDGFRLIINGDTLVNRWVNEQLHFHSRKLSVKAGQTYNIEINYKAGDDDSATLNFDVRRSAPVSIASILDAAKDVETVVFVGGISPDYEKEEAKVVAPGFDNGDRTSIELPQCQRDILAALHDAGKKIVFVNCSGSAVALTPEASRCDAILQAWYPGQEGGNAVADVLFGDYNPSGKLPVTFYASDSQLPAFDDYRMTGRTYRYLNGLEPLYHFGYGLSYTTFKVDKPVYSDGTLRVQVKNTGKREGTEVIQVYVSRPLDVDGPSKTLRAYERVTLRPGEKRIVSIPLPPSTFEWWDATASEMRILPGAFTLHVGTSSRPEDLKTLSVSL